MKDDAFLIDSILQLLNGRDIFQIDKILDEIKNKCKMETIYEYKKED